MDRVKEILSYFFAAMAIFALLCAVYEAMNQRVASTAALSGIFIASALLSYLPQLEVFKAFGVEARMDKRLDRAQEILEKIREASIANAKTTYLNLAWANRWGGMSPAVKQQALDFVNDQLNAVGVKAEEFRAIVKPYLDLLGFDLGNVFEMALSSHVINILGHDSTKESLLRAWSKEWNANGRLSPTKVAGMSQAEFARALKAEIPREYVQPDEFMKFEKFADRLSAIYAGCMERQGYTTEAINFFNEVTPLAGDHLTAYVLK